MRKFVLVALFLLLCAALVFGGAGRETSVTTPEGKVIIDAFVQRNEEFPEVDADLNKLTAFLQEKFNVEYDWIVAPEEGLDEKKSVLLASGDYPSVFYHGWFSRPEQQKYGSLGVLVPLNDLIREVGPNIQKVIDSDSAYEKGITAPDGNIYALASSEACYHCKYTPKYWINIDWLNKLGLDMPETTAEFEEVLEAFKTRDPNGNGKADEIPLSGAVDAWWCEVPDFLLSSFVYTNARDYLYLDKGKVKMAPAQPEFREGLKYLSRLYSKGLIDPQAFTQGEEQLATLGNNPDGVILGAFAGGVSGMAPEITDAPGAIWTQYEAVLPLKGPEGVQLAIYEGYGYAEGGFAITNKASDEVTQRAMEIQDWLFTLEGSLTGMFGPRGYGWDWPEEGGLGMRGEPAVFRTLPDSYQDPAFTGTFEPTYFLSFDTFMGWQQIQDTTKVAGYEKFLTLVTDEYAKYTPKEVLPLHFWMAEDVADMYAQYRTEFESFIKQNMAAFITGQKDPEADWDSYLRNLKSIGLDEYLSIVQTAYDAMK